MFEMLPASEFSPNAKISLPILNISRLSITHVINAAMIKLMIKRVRYRLAISFFILDLFRYGYTYFSIL